MSSKTYETVYFTPSHCCHRGLSHHHPLPKLLQLWTGLLAFYPCPLSPNPRYSQHISKRFFFNNVRLKMSCLPSELSDGSTFHFHKQSPYHSHRPCPVWLSCLFDLIPCFALLVHLFSGVMVWHFLECSRHASTSGSSHCPLPSPEWFPPRCLPGSLLVP